MKNKRYLIIGTLWGIALAAFAVWYRNTPNKEFPEVSPSNSVLRSSQPGANEKTEEEKTLAQKEAELEAKQIEELKGSLERANKNGSVSTTTPVPPLPQEDTKSSH